MHDTKLFLLCNLLLLAQQINALQKWNEAVSNKNEVFKQQQHEFTAPHLNAHDQTNIDDTTNNSNNTIWTARDRLLFYTLEQFALLSEFTITQAITLLRNVIKDASMLKEQHTKDLQMYLQSFNDFIVMADNFSHTNVGVQIQFSELYNIVVKFTELVEQHNTKTMQANPTTENMLLEMLLKKNGLDKLQVDFLEHFLIFMQKFNKRMDSYLDGLTDVQREEEHKMLAWYRMFNDEMDSEQKVDKFTKFFELYQ